MIAVAVAERNPGETKLKCESSRRINKKKKLEFEKATSRQILLASYY